MGVIINIGESLERSAFNILVEPIKMLLENEKEHFEKQSLLSEIYIIRKTDRYQEEFRSSTAMDGFSPTEDLEVAGINDFDEGYGKIFNNQIWTNSFVISKQTLEDKQDMTVNAKTVGFIKSYGRTRERFGFGMLSGALIGSLNFDGKKVFDCKGGDTVDGTIAGAKQVYFHETHKSPVVGVADQSNKFYCSIDLTAAKAHEKLLSVIGQVETLMGNYTDYKGNPVVVNPTKLLIPNHYKLKDVLTTALKTQYTSTMGDNGVNIQFGNWNILTSVYLNGLPGFTEADQAIVMIAPETNREFLGALWLDRIPLTVRGYIDEDTEANIWAGRARFGVGFNDFRAMAYISTGANASATAKDNGTVLTA